MSTAILKWSGIFLLCFVLQTTIVPAIAVGGVRPDLLLCALFFLAMRTGCLPAIWVGFLLGLAMDLYSPSILGQHALAMVFAGCFAGLFNERVMRADLPVRMILLFLTFLVADATELFVQLFKTSGMAGGVTPVARDLLFFSAPRALYSILFALLPSLWIRLLVPSPYRR